MIAFRIRILGLSAYVLKAFAAYSYRPNDLSRLRNELNRPSF